MRPVRTPVRDARAEEFRARARFLDEEPELPRDIVVVGASAGGLEALQPLLGALPADLPAAILVALHTAPDSPGATAEVLSRAGPLPVFYPLDGSNVEHGSVVIAPPDHHLIVDGSKLRLVRGPKENGMRPAVDPLFRSAARSYGPRVIGVLLSGALDDGTQGLLAIKQRGGLAVVQDPEEARFPCMALSGLRNVDVDQVLTAKGIADLIIRLSVPSADALDRPVALEISRARSGSPSADDRLQGIPPPVPEAITCPECGGALADVSEGDVARFQCHVGHAYGAESLMAHHAEAVERALWAALRTLDEASALRADMAERAFARSLHGLEVAYRHQAREYESRARTIRAVLKRENPPGPELEALERSAPEIA